MFNRTTALVLVAALAILDPRGRMAGLATPPLDADAIAADLLALSH